MSDTTHRGNRRTAGIVATAAVLAAGLVGFSRIASADDARPSTSKTPRIDVEMLVNGDDADRPTGPQIGVPGTATFTYVVTNAGKRPLDRVALTDSVDGAVSCPTTILAVGEKMTCSRRTVQVTAAGQYTRSAKVTARSKHRTVADTDPVHFVGKPTPPPPPPAAPSSLGDRVWLDTVANARQGMSGPGVFDEPGVQGVTVRLLNANGTPAVDLAGAQVKPQVSNQDGFYRFSNLAAGSYVVQFEHDCSYKPTQPLVGEGTRDSDAVEFETTAEGCIARTRAIALPANTDDPHVDLGLVPVS